MYVWLYFWVLYSVPLIYASVFVPLPYCFDYCNFVVWSEDGVIPPALFFFLENGLAAISLLDNHHRTMHIEGVCAAPPVKAEIGSSHPSTQNWCKNV